MKKAIALGLLFLLFLIPFASAHEISAVNTPTEVYQKSPLGVYVKFTNTSNETIVLTKVRIEILSSNGDLVNSSETNFFIPVKPNATAIAYGYMIVGVQPGDYKYNVLIYYKENGEQKEKSVISQQSLIVKTPTNPWVILAIATLIFGGTLGFLVRLGSRGIAR